MAEDNQTLTVEENARHIDGIVRMMEWLHACVQEHDRPWCFVVMDALHLTHCVRPGVVKWNDVDGFDRRLAGLGCKLVFLEASAPTLWKRGIEPRMNDQFIREYGRKFGRNHEEIHRYFVQEQKTLADLLARSSMPKLRIDNDAPQQTVIDAAYKFWNED